MAKFPLKLTSRDAGKFQVSKDHFTMLGRVVVAGALGLTPEPLSAEASCLAYLAHYRLVERQKPGVGLSSYVATAYGRAVVLEYGDPV